MGIRDIIICPAKVKSDVLREVEPKMFTEVDKRKGISIGDFISLAENGYFKKPGQIHELLEKSEIEFLLPPQEPRNPELEARVSKLKAEQENNEYKKMVKDLGPTATQSLGASIRTDIKQVTSQITAVINFVFTVIGTFVFTYKAVEYALPQSNVPAQVMMGIITSTTVALADLFFLARTI